MFPQIFKIKSYKSKVKNKLLILNAGTQHQAIGLNYKSKVAMMAYRIAVDNATDFGQRDDSQPTGVILAPPVQYRLGAIF